MSEYIFKLPDLGEGTVESEIAEWFIAVGDQVDEEDVVGTMMTDKAAVELSSPVSGKVVKLAGEPGDIVAVGAPLVVFETEATPADEPAQAAEEQPAGQQAAAPAAEPAPEPEPVPQAPEEATLDRKRVMTSPAIRRRAKELGVDLSLVPGSGPGGRITRTDFDQYIKRQAAAGGHAAAPTAATPAARTTEEKVIGLRRIIAERMSAAKREIPHFAYVEEIDITETRSAQEASERQANRSLEAPDLVAVPRACADSCAARLPAMQYDLRQGA